MSGLGDISAKVIANSISWCSDVEIVTFELEYPRYIHSEMMTHRVFSRNAASSRAIPTAKMMSVLKASPIHWGKNQSGMQAKEEVDGDTRIVAREVWHTARQHAIDAATELHKLGIHKQVVNRLLEPFQMIKVIVTSTEWENFFTLRMHEDAQPEIHQLAKVMHEALMSSNPVILDKGDWHLPYIDGGCWRQNRDNPLSLPDSIILSASQCAQVSYRNTDESIDKAYAIFEKLILSEPAHASPIEHQATPLVSKEMPGVTHEDMKGGLWSGNFREWVQARQVVSHIMNNKNKETI